MNCQQTQELFDQLSRDRLDPGTARLVRDHLDDCTDCRVAHQQTVRLQRLLSLKRYEQPSAGDLDQIVNRVHQRLVAAEEATPWGDRILARLGLDSFLSVRYGWAGACAALLVVGLVWIALRNSRDSVFEAQFVAPPPPLVIVEPPLANSPFRPAGELAHTPTLAAQPLELPTVTLTAAQRPSQPSSPRYVLDRITVTPASYETASINF